jgi:hypothetical protein
MGELERLEAEKHIDEIRKSIDHPEQREPVKPADDSAAQQEVAQLQEMLEQLHAAEDELRDMNRH